MAQATLSCRIAAIHLGGGGKIEDFDGGVDGRQFSPSVSIPSVSYADSSP